MNNIYTAALGTCVLLLFLACERPGSPDFSLEHKAQVPITTETTYQFLGGSGALIDTTREDFSSIFVIDDTEENEGLISLSKREDFDFGSLDDAIPGVDVDPTSVNSEVGEIELGAFASGNDAVAEIDFEEITGIDPNLTPAGTPIPDQTNHQIPNISFSTDYFVSATIKSGSLQVTVENQLGFDISDFDIEVFSQGNSLGSIIFTGGSDLPSGGGEKTGELEVDGEQLEDLTFTLTVSWLNTSVPANPGPFLVNQAAGKDLIASEVEAAIPSQDISSSGNGTVDNSNIEFTQPNHYIELDSGRLLINNIVNGIDLDIDELQISFPDIRRPPFNAGDALVVTFEGGSKISRASSGSGSTPEKNVSLEGMRIFAEGNEIDYNITGVTENTQAGAGSSPRIIKESDSFTANVELENLEISEAVGVLAERTVLINDDVDADGRVDLSNDEEAEVILIDGFRTLSENITGLEFADPLMGLLYNTNLDAETMIYAAIMGKSANGSPVYLSGKSDYSVDKPFDELRADGGQIPNDKLIKFRLDRPGGGASDVAGEEKFTKENSNIDEFMSNLPTEVRFIGLAELEEGEGAITAPVRFDPGMNIDLPLHFAAGASTFSDTLDTDLEGLPGDGDNQRLTEAKLSIGYKNNLPFRLELNLTMVDRQYGYVTEVPLDDQDPVAIRGANVHSETRFVESGSEGDMTISLNKEQLAILNRTRHMIMKVSFNPTSQEEVKVRAEDTVTISVKMSVAFESNIN